MASMIQGNFQENGFAADERYGYEESFQSASIGPFLRQILAAVRRNLWLVLGIIVALTAAAGIFTMLQTPKYTATTSVEINNRSAQVLGDEMDPVSEELQGWDVDRFLNTQIRILRSRTLAERVVRRLNLNDSPRFLSAMQAPSLEEFRSEAVRSNAVIRLLADNFESSPPSDSRVAELTFTSIDPGMSADVVNAFAQEFIQANLQRRYDSSSYARTFVEEQLQEARARLESSEIELNAYAREAGLIRARGAGIGESGAMNSVTTESLLQLNQATNDARAKRVAAESQWNAENSQPLLSSPAALASPAVQQLLMNRSQLQGELQGAQERYLSDHPAIERLEGDLRSVEYALKRAATEARNSVQTNFIAARSTEEGLQSRVNELQGATLEEQARSVRYNTLAREADTNRSIYDGLLQRYRELNASAGITASNVAIIDEAEPPVVPSSPHLLLNLAIALVLGVGLAAVIVFIKEQLDDRIRVPEDIEEKVGLNLLGVIPRSEFDSPDAELADPKSAISEAYGALRSAMLFSTHEGLPKLLLVTSSQASEGKSTTSYALALGMAQIGKRTLLLDADLRRPSVHELTGTSNKIGFSNLLVGDTSINEVLLPSQDPNLLILPSGPLPPSPAELLSSPRAGALFQALREKFDVVVIDSPPVLGLADAPGLSALVDGVLLVIEADGGRGGHLKAAVRRLRLMKPTILGAVLTKYDPEKAGNSHSLYYRYDYYSYRADDEAMA